jgi:riboflavin kinase/FMN adenylyltransferase
VHLFNFNKNIYGKRIKVEFKNKIREEQKFDNIDALKDQIHKDINVAKKLLNN